MKSINFEPGVVVDTKNCSNCRFRNDGICPKSKVCVTSSLNSEPSHWIEMTDAQKIEKEVKNMLDLKIYMSGMFYGGVVTKPQDLIKNVIFSGPCTIVQWSDGDKTIVRCENEDFDKEKGLAMAIVKKFFGTNESKSNYNDIFKKWIPEEEVDEQLLEKEDYDNTEILTAKQLAEKTGLSVSTVIRDCRRGIHPGAVKVDGKWLIPYSGLKKEN